MMMLTLWFAMAAEVPDLYQRSYEAESSLDYAAALAALDEMPGDEKKLYVHVLRRAWLLYLKGDSNGAIAMYDRAIQASPRAIEPKLGKLLPLLADRRWMDAEKLAAAVLKEAPDNTTARARRAWALYNLGRYAEAEKEYQQVLDAFPSDIEMMAGIGWARHQQGNKAGARAMFEAVLHVAPRHASARAGLDAQ